MTEKFLKLTNPTLTNTAELNDQKANLESRISETWSQAMNSKTAELKKRADKRIPAKMPKNKFAKNKTGRSQRHKEKTETIAKITEISQRLISNYYVHDLINHPV